jgi:ABC-type antimicrobial peptide transport system permease subunit
MILSQGVSLAVAGLALGLAGAFAVARFASSLLFGVTPADASTYSLVALTVIVVTSVATLIPARRASRIAPILALRQE